MTYRDEHDIEAILKKLQSAKPVDPGAILRAKNVVMAQVRTDASQARLKLSFGRTKLSFVQVFALRPRAMVALIVALAVLLGGGGVAAAAQGSVPGDALYGVKIVIERVAVKIAPTPQIKARVETKLAERRAHELEVLKARAVSAPPEVKVELQKNIEILKERLEMIEKQEQKLEQKQQEQREQQEQLLEFPPQAATIPIPNDETRQFVENAEELFIGLRTQKAELKQKGVDIDSGIDAALQELQTLITQARVLWNDRKFSDVRALEPQIQELLVRIAHLLNVEDSVQEE